MHAKVERVWEFMSKVSAKVHGKVHEKVKQACKLDWAALCKVHVPKLCLSIISNFINSKFCDEKI